MQNCDGCGNPYDFEKHASAWCKTCGKKSLCIHCYDTHECIPGKSRHMIIITNPPWISRLINSQFCKECKNEKVACVCMEECEK